MTKMSGEMAEISVTDFITLPKLGRVHQCMDPTTPQNWSGPDPWTGWKLIQTDKQTKHKETHAIKTNNSLAEATMTMTSKSTKFVTFYHKAGSELDCTDCNSHPILTICHKVTLSYVHHLFNIRTTACRDLVSNC